jgi:hypothetical protein
MGAEPAKDSPTRIKNKAVGFGFGQRPRPLPLHTVTATVLIHPDGHLCLVSVGRWALGNGRYNILYNISATWA